MAVGAGQPCSPSSVPGLCPFWTPRTLTLEILEVLWVLVDTSPLIFSFWDSRGCGTCFLRGVYSFQSDACSAMTGTASSALLPLERCAASLSAFQALPSLPCVCLSLPSFPTSVSVVLVADFLHVPVRGAVSSLATLVGGAPRPHRPSSAQHPRSQVEWG